jgi:hypothetical protein
VACPVYSVKIPDGVSALAMRELHEEDRVHLDYLSRGTLLGRRKLLRLGNIISLERTCGCDRENAEEELAQHGLQNERHKTTPCHDA